MPGPFSQPLLLLTLICAQAHTFGSVPPPDPYEHKHSNQNLVSFFHAASFAPAPRRIYPPLHRLAILCLLSIIASIFNMNHFRPSSDAQPCSPITSLSPKIKSPLDLSSFALGFEHGTCLLHYLCLHRRASLPVLIPSLRICNLLLSPFLNSSPFDCLSSSSLFLPPFAIFAQILQTTFGKSLPTSDTVRHG